MDVPIRPDLERFVKEAVASGRFETAAEVVENALLLLQRLDPETGLAQSDLEQRLEEGERDVQEGRVSVADEEFWARLKSDAREFFRQRRSRSA